MTVEEMIYLFEVKSQRELKPVEKFVLLQGWQGKTYTDMAQASRYGEHYLRKVASLLWRELSDLFGGSINKTNFRVMLQERPLTSEEKLLLEAFYHNKLLEKKPQFPGSPLSVWSQFYIDRPPIEELARAEITKVGSVIRIKGPKKMGKNSLLLRIMEHGKSLRMRSAYIDFQQAEEETFDNLDRFLRWFCATVTVQLGLPQQLHLYWDENIGSKVSATLYFQGYVLSTIESPIILALNEVNLLFQYPAIAREFLPILRSWHEEAKQMTIWQKLRLIVVYSTESYISLKINQSPFNVGLPIQLSEFTLAQVDRLAELYKLPLNVMELKQLMEIVGGHPYLIQLAFYHLLQEYQALAEVLEPSDRPVGVSSPSPDAGSDREQALKKQLRNLLELAPTQAGIYKDHLRSLRATLYDRPELLTGFKELLLTDTPVVLADMIAYKLESLGLVKIQGNLCSIRCNLYRIYFSDQLLLETDRQVSLSSNIQWNLIEQLAKYKQAFDRLIHRDHLTGLANRRYFKHYLEQEWQNFENKPLSLLICHIDFLDIYHQGHGHEATDDCLQKVANVIFEVVHQPFELIGRLDGAKFAVLLPGQTTEQALDISREICQQVKALAIAHDNSSIDGMPEIITVSIGVASMKSSDCQTNVETVIHAAEKALTQAKQWGGDRVVVNVVNNDV